jgi:formylglycine-generating enzyme required for sulfatase activity
MSIQVACPRCELLLEREDHESLPTHCPACNTRLTCPQCGSALTRHPDQTQAIQCSQCAITLGGTETGVAGHPSATQLDVSLAIPGFQLRGKLGSGGMGIVFRAYQENMDREVAIKVLPPALAVDPQLLLRFRNEAKMVGELVEPHILQVYSIGEAQGVPYIVMPLIEGGNLGSILTDRAQAKAGKAPHNPHPWALLDDKAYLDKVLPLLDQVVDAVTVLHGAGVLHRDLKPNNVLVDGRGNGWVSDFGLARKEWEGIGTRHGLGLGTPGYASLEQSAGHENIDFRSDLFSLGATLYQILTLRMPYGKSGPKQDSSPPSYPSHHQRMLPRDFDAVLLKALEIDPRRRYPTAQEMRDDWRRVRSGQLPKAKLAGPIERAARVVLRHPIGAIGVVVIVLLLAAVGAIVMHDPTVHRTVHVTTDPPGAKIALVPLHPDTGYPVVEKMIRPTQVTPVTVRLPVGEYLVEAQLGDNRFHEVFRVIPWPDQVQENNNCPHLTWVDRPDASVDLPTITIPPAAVTQDMVRFEGGQFTMGAAYLKIVPPHPHWVPAFYLDQTEVTVGGYRRTRGRVPIKLVGTHAPESHAVTRVSFDQALACAEKMGKRLPYEEEYEFAATDAGTRLFPWGDDASKITSWPLGKVRKPDYDRTPTNPAVYGLFSNVAEWTLSWPNQYPGTDAETVEGFYASEMLQHFRGARIVRGGPVSVVGGNPDPLGKDQKDHWDPRWRYSFTHTLDYPGLGFRCARSAEPRFLK